MRASTFTLAAWAALLVAVVPAPGQAQTAATAPAASAAVLQAHAKAATDRQEERIAMLHRQLKITAAQQPQWDAFIGVMRGNLAHMHDVYGQNADRGDATALDDMHAYAAITTAHAQDVQKLTPAFEALYAAMSAEQKKTADAVFHQYARQQARLATTR